MGNPNTTRNSTSNTTIKVLNFPNKPQTLALLETRSMPALG